MIGTWAKHKDAISQVHGTGRDARLHVSKTQLLTLPWEERCKLCYDPETPEAVVHAMKLDPDASVRGATAARKNVIAGEVRNPFEQ